MNINKTISDNLLLNLPIYINNDALKDDIKNFMTSRNKKSKSIKIIERILKDHQKGHFISYLVEMGKIEYGIRELQPHLRDHVVHALHTFILGIYLNNELYNLDIDPFQWKIASLLHDIAYPIELAFKCLINPFIVKINKNNVSLIDFNLKFYNLHNGDGLQLIEDCLCNWGFNLHVRDEYHRLLNGGNICHGMLSSLSVLYFIDLLYSDHNWPRSDFDDHVVPACAAIFIHNLPTDYLIKNELVIDPSRAPLAFLLKLSDCLQEWERPSKEYPEGFSACQFDVKIEAGDLLYYADLPVKKINKIKKDLKPLIGSNVKIKGPGD